jgi:hypothetical protein
MASAQTESQQLDQFQTFMIGISATLLGLSVPFFTQVDKGVSEPERWLIVSIWVLLGINVFVGIANRFHGAVMTADKRFEGIVPNTIEFLWDKGVAITAILLRFFVGYQRQVRKSTSWS